MIELARDVREEVADRYADTPEEKRFPSSGRRPEIASFAGSATTSNRSV